MSGSLNLDKPYLPLLKSVEFQPIFILGLARSGTTLLYKLLTQSQSFNYIQAYHIVRYDEILFNYFEQQEINARANLNNQYKALGVENRIFDQVPVDSTFPGEYRVILQNKGKLLNWKRDFLKYLKRILKGDHFSALLFEALKLSPESRVLMLESCKKVQLISDQDKPLLLKNPLDFNNFIYLKDVFPTAKFVFIYREPIDILNSQIKALISVLGSQNSYLNVQSKIYQNLTQNPFIFPALKAAISSGRMTQLILDILQNNLTQAVDFFKSNIDLLPHDDYIVVTYERLCEQPNQAIAQIFDFLQISPNLTVDYKKMIAPRPRKLLSELESNYPKLRQQLHAYSSLESFSDAWFINKIDSPIA
ncbi:MAG: sulfotransferase [Leptolyngbya sp. SIO3F4]|nr:sulfotransferase [Leptolyngbya sp. SIO3F4]